LHSKFKNASLTASTPLSSCCMSKKFKQVRVQLAYQKISNQQKKKFDLRQLRRPVQKNASFEFWTNSFL
jgi:hypothetical protein